MSELFSTIFSSPLGPLKITGNTSHITQVTFWNEEGLNPGTVNIGPLPEIILTCVNQLEEYFNGDRKIFNLPLDQKGTTFQLRVWNELLSVPYGKTISYLELSKRLGDVKAIRAAASTNGKNQIAIIFPCHRVIGSGNNLVGYAGGLSKKRWLLQHEAKVAYGVQTLF